ncbi:U2 snRNP-associated SURP motif-containing protein-like isoform X2 [Lytechinus variegatus]|uniref:U2 snRNP-associated SURP motif-containing protein-like isoform X2 n=1 Tax=Lytechinus variegatus TaxID=7654 RepID=UPI001BB12B1F|nr:U2 snRNP-associated SURP motif-containing protein-like isoform X2 [Lytechinus variegatus]
MAGLAPGTAKNISKTKLQAFSIGQMNLTKKKSKRIEDELKKKEQEKETAKIFEEFVASFEEAPSTSKSFIRGNTINPETKVERSDGKTGKLYKPTSKIAESVYAKQQRAIEEAQKARAESQKAKLKKEKEREKQKKSNLELFKEELRVLQKEREERHKLRKARGDEDDYDEPILPTPPSSSAGSASEIRLPGIEEYNYGSHDYGDPNTTNIFLGSINPKMNEEMLCKEFVQYGPLASVKIMWPRTDAERQRNRNCGFVAFMNRRDAERAMRALNGKEIMNYEMKLGWGKAVVLPPHPVYIPEAMMELTMPPPPSGLPFNSQLKKSSKREAPKLPPPGIALTLEEEQELQETLKEAVVKVVIPTERALLQIIHRMIEFVVNEGPMFEAMIMNREINNPMFRFLFDNQTPAHVYYRWKLFSILQGDSITKWSTDEFLMFKDGSVWRPPPINPYQQGMPDALAPKHALNKAPLPPPDLPKKKMLTNHQRDKLEDMLRAITMDRYKIGETMVYCLDHADSAEEIVECIAESLAILETPLPKKIGRFFLVSDILFNSSTKVANASFFRKYFENHLPVIMQDVRETYKSIQQRLKAEQFKQRVMACFRSWNDWAVYPNDFLVRLQNIFLGFLDHDSAKEDIQIKDPEALAQPEVDLDGIPVDEAKKTKVDAADFDGVPLEDEQDLDGAPIPTEGAEDLDGAPLDGDPIDGAPIDGAPIDGAPIDGAPIDGAPIQDDDDQRSLTSSGGLKSDESKGFKVAPSKWETVDSSLLEAQAMTTSKWETLAEEEDEVEEQEEQNEEEEMEERDENGEDGEDSVQSLATDFYKSSEMNEIKRAKLREIEVKVMKFQDDVESGRRSRKKDMTLQEQVERYRHKLMQKEKEKEAERQRSKNKDRERDRLKEFERARERERERFAKELEGSSGEEEMMPIPSSRRDRDRKRRRSRTRSRSRSPSSRRSTSRKGSPDSLSVLREYSDSPSSRSHRSGSHSPKRTPSHRSRSPKKSRRSRSRSRSPRRRRSPSPGRRLQRSRSRSPHRRSSHKKKSKH